LFGIAFIARARACAASLVVVIVVARAGGGGVTPAQR
jgi:hypothetical protein